MERVTEEVEMYRKGIDVQAKMDEVKKGEGTDKGETKMIRHRHLREYSGRM